ncbi:MAG TPA: DsrE/DsrF/DrsH-like family protein [Candidatus Limnocylindria bacterium]|nr:DsrE/DsrF/DrsH-like family protein [Candidatus Limnocylindria bacterium]
MEATETPLSVILFSGTDDKLNAAAVLTVGAAAMGRPVNLFLQYYAVDAFRSDRISKEHGLAPEATAAQRSIVAAHPGAHWSELLRQAKELGDVRIHACALSTEMFGIAKDDLDPLVDGIEGVAAFMTDAQGPITFI